MTAAFSICVYCGSRAGARPEYAEAAVAVGRWIGQHAGQLVYGGGRNGLMGIVADATLAAGGTVLGVIPKALVEKEWAHNGCTVLRVVETMHDRKRLMADRADAFLALPGGIGTFEEFFEAWTWRQLGYHSKPVGLLNVGGIYDGLSRFLQTIVAEQFVTDWQMGLVRMDTDAPRLLQQLVADAAQGRSLRLDEI